MKQITIDEFKKQPFEELESDAFSKFYKYGNYLLEQIFVEDQRETIYLLGAFEKISKLDIPNVCKYYEAQYNPKLNTVEVLRHYYPKRLLDQQITKELVITVIQQLYQTLATLEGYGVFILSLKPSNLFYDGSLYVSGIVRSDKFLQSQPIYQSDELRQFVKEFMRTQQYNITLKYKFCSHAMSYSALVIVVQFVLQQLETEQLSNIMRWLDSKVDNLTSIPSTNKLLDMIEQNFQAVRLFIEQAKLILMQEQFQPQGDVAIQLMSLASELHLKNNCIMFGDIIPHKEPTIQQNNLFQNKIQTQPIKKIDKPKDVSKRTGGGYQLKKK